MGRTLRIGIHSPYLGSAYGGGEKYLGVTAETIRDAFPDHDLELLSTVPVDRERYERTLGLDLRGIRLVATNPAPAGALRRLAAAPMLRSYRNLAVAAQAARFTRRYDLYLAMVYAVPAFSRARAGVILCQFPYPLDKDRRLRSLPYRGLRRLLLPRELDSFERVICQSEYVREWTKRYWARDAEVVNPPIDIPEDEPDYAAKRRIILSVGRFLARGHAKRHDTMIKVFAGLASGVLRGWELHLAGSRHLDAESQAYYRQLEQLAEGLPVRLRPDLDGRELDELYRTAAIYWHAAGFGADANASPEALEHFGMTTVEAMARGTVPVAIARGGQVEVVHDGVDGYLWQELTELGERTTRLARDAGLRRRLGAAARESSRRYCKAEFKRKMAGLLRPVVERLEAQDS